MDRVCVKKAEIDLATVIVNNLTGKQLLKIPYLKREDCVIKYIGTVKCRVQR